MKPVFFSLALALAAGPAAAATFSTSPWGVLLDGGDVTGSFDVEGGLEVSASATLPTAAASADLASGALRAKATCGSQQCAARAIMKDLIT